jgi:hypothetical protein
MKQTDDGFLDEGQEATPAFVLPERLARTDVAALLAQPGSHQRRPQIAHDVGIISTLMPLMQILICRVALWGHAQSDLPGLGLIRVGHGFPPSFRRCFDLGMAQARVGSLSA